MTTVPGGKRQAAEQGASAHPARYDTVLAMNLTIETEQEDDGRWIAEVPELAGVLAYGSTREEAMAKAQALALRVLAEQLEHGEARAVDLSMSVAAG